MTTDAGVSRQAVCVGEIKVDKWSLRWYDKEAIKVGRSMDRLEWRKDMGPDYQGSVFGVNKVNR